MPVISMPDVASTPVSSPCVQVCALNADRVCIGCGRSLGEIAEWGAATDARRRAIRAEAARRLAGIKALQPDEAARR